MKAPLPFIISIFFCLQLFPGMTCRAFDEPLFNKVSFSADGVFLGDQEKETLLEALVAIASNFSDYSKVDEDLKEKALAIALNLDPLHYLSRSTYRDLMRSKTPGKTSFFTSLSSVSETLWTFASRMLQAPVEPEERKLAALLIDLSLILHPDPPDERILKLAEASKGKAVPWADFVMLQPETSKSSARSEFFMKESRELLRAEKAKVASAPPVMPAPPAEIPSPPAPANKTLPAAETISQSLPAVVKIIANGENDAGGESLAAGNLSLTVRSPAGETEIERFPFVGEAQPEDYPQLPILTDSESVPLPNLKMSPKFLEEHAVSWPPYTIGSLKFETNDALPAARMFCRVKPGPWIPILLKSTLGNTTPNDQFAFTEVSVSPDEIKKILSVAARLNKTYLLFPERNFEALIDHLQTSNELDLLFDSEIITYANLEEASQLLRSETPQALKDASLAFAEIKRASEKMSLSELARYPSAQKRLEAIINQFKNHGSARAMLEYGLRPVSAKAEVLKSVNAITTAIEPFFELEDRGVDTSALKQKLESSDLMLFKMRTQIHADVRDYHGQAEELIEVAEIYLNLSNKDTSIATQKLNTIQELINELRAEKDAIEANLAP